jgi:hypothetical protein
MKREKNKFLHSISILNCDVLFSKTKGKFERISDPIKCKKK